MPPRLITKADLARIAGCAPSTVTRAAKTTLRAAMVADRIDVDHPAAKRFVAKRKRTRS